MSIAISSSPGAGDGLSPVLPAMTMPDRTADAASAVEAQLRALQELDLHDLRVRWRKLFRSTAPAHLPKFLLLRILGYKVQAQAYDDLDRETQRYLDRVAREWRKRTETGARLGKAPPPVPPVPGRRALKPGTLFVREHAGTVHSVTAVEGGFAWNGTTYRSLSEVARAITGTPWNGPRFFGLRDRAKPTATRSADREVRP